MWKAPSGGLGMHLLILPWTPRACTFELLYTRHHRQPSYCPLCLGCPSVAHTSSKTWLRWHFSWSLQPHLDGPDFNLLAEYLFLQLHNYTQHLTYTPAPWTDGEILEGKVFIDIVSLPRMFSCICLEAWEAPLPLDTQLTTF